MAEGRRGRISRATYERTVGQMLTRDWFALEECEVLMQLGLVEQLVTAYPNRYFTKGAAVRAILDKACAQVIASCQASSNQQSQRIATFLTARLKGQTVTAIAREWGLSREYVSRAIMRRAIRLVTDRVLAIGKSQLPTREDAQAAGIVPISSVA